MKNRRNTVSATLGMDVGYTLLHYFSCVQLTSDTSLYRMKRTVDTLRILEKTRVMEDKMTQRSSNSKRTKGHRTRSVRMLQLLAH